MISLQQIARALGGEISGGQVRAPGPGHSSKDRSLNIKLDTEAPGGFIVHSFAGDDPIACKDHVREKLGLGAFKANGAGKSRIVATYDYTDEHGELLFQVCRFEPKDFRQRRPDGLGGYDWKLGNTRRVLYRLPEVLGAASQGRPIFIVEGEKAADALTRLGVTATCSPGGAGKWRAEYSQYLAGSGDVIILPDNDEPGEKHAADVVKAIPTARVLRLPGLANKGDPHDWTTAGGTAAELWRLVETAEAQQPKPKAEDCGRGSAWREPEPEWPTIDETAFHGLAGELVDTIAPHSEADPVAILIQFLAAAGNMIGRRCYYQVESDRHHSNLFAVLVGPSSKARKGTSWGRVSAVAKLADHQWAEDRCKGGLSSGEGLINEVRDEFVKWNGKEKEWESVDPGVLDKRLMIIEPEFAGALAVMERHGNTLSPLLRKAWDGDKLATMTRNAPLKATGAHVSIIGHITEAELRARLTRTDAANGFANRFIFPMVKRSKELPFGGSLTDSQVVMLGERLKEAIERLPENHRITMTDEARSMWAGVYSKLSADKPGMLGAITARAEAQTVRLAMVYALLDGELQIDLPQLAAGLAVWNYCEASAQHIFGDATGDPVVDEIATALRNAGDAGLTRTAVHHLFGRHQSGDRIGAALANLLKQGKVRCEVRSTGGRPTEVWFDAN